MLYCSICFCLCVCVYVCVCVCVRFVVPGGTLLDLCCGRGGDIHKWKDAKVSTCSFTHTQTHGRQTYRQSTCMHEGKLACMLTVCCCRALRPPCMCVCVCVCPQVKRVLGVDLSPNEIDEARRRYVELQHAQQRQSRGACESAHCQAWLHDISPFMPDYVELQHAQQRQSRGTCDTPLYRQLCTALPSPGGSPCRDSTVSRMPAAAHEDRD